MIILSVFHWKFKASESTTHILGKFFIYLVSEAVNEVPLSGHALARILFIAYLKLVIAIRPISNFTVIPSYSSVVMSFVKDEIYKSISTHHSLT